MPDQSKVVSGQTAELLLATRLLNIVQEVHEAATKDDVTKIRLLLGKLESQIEIYNTQSKR